jgi:hypothetical protein
VGTVPTAKELNSGSADTIKGVTRVMVVMVVIKIGWKPDTAAMRATLLKNTAVMILLIF